MHDENPLELLAFRWKDALRVAAESSCPGLFRRPPRSFFGSTSCCLSSTHGIYIFFFCCSASAGLPLSPPWPVRGTSYIRSAAESLIYRERDGGRVRY